MAGLGCRARNRGKTKSHQQGAVGAAEQSHRAAAVPNKDKEEVQQASDEPAEAVVDGVIQQLYEQASAKPAKAVVDSAVQQLHKQIAALRRKCHTCYMKERRTKDLHKTVDEKSNSWLHSIA